ncbi:MAG: hypothetical protein V3T05_02605, partial [Myxococcota bacterium]
RLGRAGRLKLEWFSAVRRYPRYRPLSDRGVQGQVVINELFLHLADGEWMWDVGPFEWLGPQHARIPYMQITPGSDPRILERRSHTLRPRAVIATHDSRLGPRIFVELDPVWFAPDERYTEQRLRRQLECYQHVFHARSPRGITWYTSHFRDSRPALIVFVVPDTPAAAFRRDRLAEDVARLSHGTVTADCVVASDAAAIRRLVGIRAGDDRILTDRASPQGPRSTP